MVCCLKSNSETRDFVVRVTLTAVFSVIIRKNLKDEDSHFLNFYQIMSCEAVLISIFEKLTRYTR
jgi:hypothetical protein